MLNPSIDARSGIMLLKNGWASHGNSNQSVQTVNTCAFDSVYYAVATMYADYGNVKSQIDKLAPKSSFCSLVVEMFKPAAKDTIKHTALHKARNEFLRSIFKSAELAFESALIYVDCASNVNYTMEKALPRNRERNNVIDVMNT